MSYSKVHFLPFEAFWRPCEVVLTSDTITMRVSNCSAEIGSNLKRGGHFEVMRRPLVQLRLCQMASVTKGAKGWSIWRMASRVTLRRGMFL